MPKEGSRTPTECTLLWENNMLGVGLSD